MDTLGKGWVNNEETITSSINSDTTMSFLFKFIRAFGILGGVFIVIATILVVPIASGLYFLGDPVGYFVGATVGALTLVSLLAAMDLNF